MKTKAEETLDKVTESGAVAKKIVFCYIPGDQYVEGYGYRVAFVTEGEDGYRSTGTWPYSPDPGQVMPWFWGPSLDDAYRHATAYNKRLGISEEEALKIVSDSMFKGNRADRG